MTRRGILKKKKVGILNLSINNTNIKIKYQTYQKKPHSRTNKVNFDPNLEKIKIVEYWDEYRDIKKKLFQTFEENNKSNEEAIHEFYNESDSDDSIGLEL